MKDLLPQSAFTQQLDVAVAWLSNVDLHTLSGHFNDDALKSGKVNAASDARARGFRALALCPILRC